MLQFFAIKLIEREIRDLERKDTEDSKILIELTILKKIVISNTECIGIDFGEFQQNIDDKIVLLVDSDEFDKILRLSKAYKVYEIFRNEMEGCADE